MSAALTGRQRRQARHALGLPNRFAASFRNHAWTIAGSAPHRVWMAMVVNGHARIVSRGDMFRFALTPQGARAALEPGESLDEDDFPPLPGDAGETDDAGETGDPFNPHGSGPVPIEARCAEALS